MGKTSRNPPTEDLVSQSNHDQTATAFRLSHEENVVEYVQWNKRRLQAEHRRWLDHPYHPGRQLRRVPVPGVPDGPDLALGFNWPLTAGLIFAAMVWAGTAWLFVNLR
jgi:hypothetical protein